MSRRWGPFEEVQLRPTRLGLAFLVLIVLTLIGCVNYSLSLGYVLTFLLGGVWVVTAAQANRAARGLSAQLSLSPDAQAGEVTLRAQVGAPTGAPPTLAGTPAELRVLATQAGAQTPLTLPLRLRAEPQTVTLPVPGAVRGPLELGRVQVVVSDLLGLWQAWTPQAPGGPFLIAPAPEQTAPPAPTVPQAGGGQAGERRSPGGEEFAGLRPYQASDGPRLVSWRHAARTGALVSREFDSPVAPVVALDWQATAALGDPEARLSRLSAWLHAARAQHRPIRLRLPVSGAGQGGSGPGVGGPELSGSADALFVPVLARLAAQPPFTRPAWPLPQPGPGLDPGALRFTLLALGVACLPTALRSPVAGLLSALILAYVWGRSLPRSRWPDLGPAGLALVTVGALGGLYGLYGSLLGLEAAGAALTLLVTFKAAETRNRHDARLLTLLGIFLVCTHFFMDQGPLTALHSLIATGLLLAAAALWNHVPSEEVAPGRPGTPRPTLTRQLTRGVFGAMARALPLAALLFVFFPRPDGPPWRLPLSQNSRTGLSETITAGDYSRLAQNREVAFRADFGGALPGPEERYWRGPVYEDFDGVRWNQSRGGFFPMPSVESLTGAPSWTYTLTPASAQSGRWLLALDFPVGRPQGSVITPGFQALWATARPLPRYTLQSQPAALGRAESQARLQLNLGLPPGVNPRAVTQAAQWRTLPPEQRVRAALDWISQGDFRYTLNPPTLPEKDRVDAFLYSSRQGFCEHFSSAFAVLMRAAGVPARIVGGYQGGELNPDGGYLIVRQSDAHAWNEVWLEGRGWVRVDPTAAVAPARIRTDLGTALAQPRAEAPRERSLWQRLSLRVDALHNRWNTWVADYDSGRQRDLLAGFGIREVGSVPYVLALGLLAALFILPAALLTRRPRLTLTDPAAREWARLSERLGVPRAPGETPSAYAARLSALRPELAPSLRRAAELHNRLRYAPPGAAGHTDRAAALAELRALVRSLRR